MSTAVASPVVPQPAPPVRMNRSRQKLIEAAIEWVLFGCASLSIIITVAIAALVLTGTYEFFMYQDERPLAWGEVWSRFVQFFTGQHWNAGFANAEYGILPLLFGTLCVALIAAAVALPIGLTTAIYLSEYASPRMRVIAKPTLELLAGIPTVVYGFFAVAFLTPHVLAPVFAFFGMQIGNPYNQLAGGIVVGIMIIPMVASLSEDAIRAVPRSLRDGAIALGATKFETSLKVTVPAALSGITASFILAISRAIGETMAVSLACGDTARFTLNPLEGFATMTSFIVRIAKGDVRVGSTDYNSLFAVAAVLFFMTLCLNIVAQKVLKRYRMVYQ
ncbi:MAG: phosphate ABC transporter permease subunit PstC [Gemmataceae bacterium]|nr:phosphate ABC transporter permease subunit PstC [Gemmataceae bacterium]